MDVFNPNGQKHHIEKNTVQETLIIPLYGRYVCEDGDGRSGEGTYGNRPEIHKCSILSSQNDHTSELD